MQSRLSFVIIAAAVTLAAGISFATTAPAKESGAGECQTLQEADRTKTTICYYRSSPGRTHAAKHSAHASVNQCQNFRDIDGTITTVCYYRSGQGKPTVNLLKGNN